MSFRLPTSDHPAREAIGDLAHVAEILNPANAAKLPCFREALVQARRTIEADRSIRAVNVICLRADDERWLVSVGPRGGWKRLWNFGTGRN